MTHDTETYTLAIQSITRFIIGGLQDKDYQIISGRRLAGKLDITHRGVTRQVFREYIRENGFVKLYHNEDGTVYGDADDSFRKNLCPNGLTEEERRPIGMDSETRRVIW